MKTPSLLVGLVALGSSCWYSTAIQAQGFQPQVVEVQSREAAIVESACQVLNEIMAIPAKGIPRSLVADAQGIAIMPGLLKGGFVVGVRHGRGVVVVRDENRGWKPPTFITITGGSFGWQVGVQATDLVLVFMTRNSVDGLMRGQFTIGAGVAAAAGPVGRQAEAATDARLKAEIFSYSRSRGLFAGLALDGSVIQVDTQANAAYYRPLAPGQAGPPQPLPPSGVRLLQEIAKYTSAESGGIGAAGSPRRSGVEDIQALRRALADSSRRLYAVLDERWRGYLALPAEVYGTDRPLPMDGLGQALRRFDQVATNPQYQALTQRAEFQETHDLLRKLYTRQTPSTALRLPPPPPDRN